MPQEARLQDVGSGHAPAADGWFTVNLADAAWIVNPAFGARCLFEADARVLRERPDLSVQRFEQLGIAVAVLDPGTPSSLYHAESAQEDFLVLAGTCVATIEGEDRELGVWDFVHCPPGTAHSFLATGAEPCVLLMVGARPPEGKTYDYPLEDTTSPHEALARYPHWEPGRPSAWDALPWNRD
jgi:uncharacterized cupin superfamily protein